MTPCRWDSEGCLLDRDMRSCGTSCPDHGLKRPGNQNPVTRDQITRALREMHLRYGPGFRVVDLQKHSLFELVNKHFGTINHAKKALGISVPEGRTRKKDEDSEDVHHEGYLNPDRWRHKKRKCSCGLSYDALYKNHGTSERPAWRLWRWFCGVCHERQKGTDNSIYANENEYATGGGSRTMRR